MLDLDPLLSAAEVITRILEDFQAYTPGTKEHARTQLVLDYEVNFRLMLYILPRMHGWRGDAKYAAGGSEENPQYWDERGSPIQHKGIADKGRSSYDPNVAPPDTRCDLGKFSGYGFFCYFSRTPVSRRSK